MGNYSKQTYLFIFFLFLCSLIKAQEKDIKGTIYDEKGNPISYATITLSKDSAAKDIVGYALTADDGTFSFKLKQYNEKIWITARCLGYITYKKYYPSLSDTNILISLSEDAVSLSEVVVKGSSSGVSIKKDTIIFNPKIFATGTERNVGELIKKMPGMEVDNSGNVSYQGKKVGKVLVDGEDVLSASSGGAINTLPADYVSSIELLENYSDGDVSYKFKSNETLSRPSRW